MVALSSGYVQIVSRRLSVSSPGQCSWGGTTRDKTPRTEVGPAADWSMRLPAGMVASGLVGAVGALTAWTCQAVRLSVTVNAHCQRLQLLLVQLPIRSQSSRQHQGPRLSIAAGARLHGTVHWIAATRPVHRT